jgi:uncharacterized membrane protein
MSLESLITILGMAAVTYGIRAGGLLLSTRLPTTGFVASFMKHVPGAVLASLVAPAILGGGPTEAIASLIVAIAYLVARNLFIAMILGVAFVFLARSLFPIF